MGSHIQKQKNPHFADAPCRPVERPPPAGPLPHLRPRSGRHPRPQSPPGAILRKGLAKRPSADQELEMRQLLVPRRPCQEPHQRRLWEMRARALQVRFKNKEKRKKSFEGIPRGLRVVEVEMRWFCPPCCSSINNEMKDTKTVLKMFLKMSNGKRELSLI